MKKLTIHSHGEMYGASVSHTIDFDCQLVDNLVIDNQDGSSRMSADYYSWGDRHITIQMTCLDLRITAEQAKRLLADLPEAIEKAEAPEDD